MGGSTVDLRLPERTVRELIRSLREVLEMKGQSFRGFMRKSFRDLFKERLELGKIPSGLGKSWNIMCKRAMLIHFT